MARVASAIGFVANERAQAGVERLGRQRHRLDRAELGLDAGGPPAPTGASGLSLTGCFSSPRSKRKVGVAGSPSKIRTSPALLVSGWPGTRSVRTACGSKNARKA